MNKLKLLKLGVTLKWKEPCKLPPFIGNTLRGAFGYALNEFGEAYEAVFKANSAESIPNPFVISAPYPGKGEYSKGDTLNFTLLLIGSAIRYQKEVVRAISTMCKGKLEQAEVSNVTTIYDNEWSDFGAVAIPRCDKLTVNFINPTEILSSKSAVAEVDFDRFTASLFGRISALCDNYGETEFVVPYSLIDRPPKIRAEYEVEPIRFQTSGQPIEGFIGKITYWGNVTRYLPYIDLGGEIHIGKKTTRSCGEYTFEI